MSASLGRVLFPWLLPLAVTGGAAALHVALHVPRGEIEPRPGDAPAALQPARVSNRGGGGFRPRRAVRLTELRRELESVAFEDEPLDEGFARAHEGVLSRALGLARDVAFEGAPEVPQLESDASCRSLRCRIDVCSPFPPELDLFTASLQALQAGDEPLFHRVDVEQSTRGALGKEPAHEPCYRILVWFEHDLPQRDAIHVPRPGGSTSAD